MTSSLSINQMEGIPTLYLNFLVVLGSYIKFLVDVIDILTWKNPNQSLLVVMLVISFCLNPEMVCVWVTLFLFCETNPSLV
jgi:hypothetical protein